MYANSPNNSSTSFSDVDEDDVEVDAKEMQVENYGYYPPDVVPVAAQWAPAPRRRPRTPPHSPASRLPPEILIHTLKQLHSTRDLHSSLLVSRTWCECAVELLWHRPSFADLNRFVQMLQVLCADGKTFEYARFVRRLNFVYLGRELTDTLFVRLERCVKLERLTLVNCVEITDDALFRVLPLCANLVALDLTNLSCTTDRTIVELARAATKLQGINLGGCKAITDLGVGALAAHCPLLRRIKLSNVKNITDRSISALARRCSLLLEIDLNGCPRVTDASVRDLWTYCSHLRELRLAQCADVTDLAFPANPQTPMETPLGVHPFPNGPSAVSLHDGFAPLVLSRSCEHLRMLDLTACNLLTDEAVEGIISNAPKIRNLVFAKCSQLTDAAVESICKLGKHLHYLHLGHASSITDRSVRTLARSCTRLRYIDLACCPLLTDMSVFELSALPKLRRIGLVRVTNLTDQAIFALADRHSTLERIHLSYCEHITVLAIHFLLQRLARLTHLSLTGIPAFRRYELQQFCRPPPREFNSNQRAAFCVYSGKGVNDLRMYLAELMAHVQQEAESGDNDTDYDAEEDEDVTVYQDSRSGRDRHSHGARFGHVESVETPRVGHVLPSERSPRRRSTTDTLIPPPRASGSRTVVSPTRRQALSPVVVPVPVTHEEVFQEPTPVSGMFRTTNVTLRRNARTPAAAPATAPLNEDTNPSSVATTPSPTVQGSDGATPSTGSGMRVRRVRGFGHDLIVEPPSPSPPMPTYASRSSSFPRQSYTHARSRSKASDQSNSSGTGGTAASHADGATFFRTYGVGMNGVGAASDGVSAGMRTPDLVFAELGHGRGLNAGDAGPGPSTLMHASATWRSGEQNGNGTESSSSSPQDPAQPKVPRFVLYSESAEEEEARVQRGRTGKSVLADSSNGLYRHSEPSSLSRESLALSWPPPVPISMPTSQSHQHHASSPIPYLSSSSLALSPTTRELQASVHSALGGGSSSRGTSSEDLLGADGGARGRSVRRGLKSTLNAAEHYASALFFGRSGSGSGSSSSSARNLDLGATGGQRQDRH